MKKLIVLIVFNCLLVNGYSQDKTTSTIPSNKIQPVEIGFEDNIIAPDLQIKRLTATPVRDSVLLTLTYSTKRPRFLSFFNPPWGTIIMYFDREGLKPNDTITSFRIAKNNLQGVDHITMRFSIRNNAEKDRNFIFLKTNDPSVQKALGLNGIRGDRKFFNNIFPFPSSLLIIIALCFLVPLLLFIWNKAISYTSVIDRLIKNKWLSFNIKALLFSVVFILVVLLATGHIKDKLPVMVYFNLLLH